MSDPLGIDPSSLNDLFDYVQQNSNIFFSEDALDCIESKLHWKLPSRLDTSKVSVSLPDGMPIYPEPKYVPQSATPRTSPESPIPTSVDLSSEPVSVTIDDVSRDPRLVCVLDHPGRHAQFKHWIQQGLVDESSCKRLTLKESISRPNVSDTVVAVPAVDKPSYLPHDWSSRCQLVNHLVTADFSKCDLQDSTIPELCEWLKELFTRWNISDRPAIANLVFPAIKPVQTAVVADVDFSFNPLLSATGLHSLLQFLESLPRLRIRVFRAEGLQLTDLSIFMNLRYIQQLHVSDNSVNAHEVASLALHLVQQRTQTARLHSVHEPDFPSLAFSLPLFLAVWNNKCEAQAVMHALSDLNPCIAEASGCEGAGQCRRFGEKCRIHLCGLSRQTRYFQVLPFFSIHALQISLPVVIRGVKIIRRIIFIFPSKQTLVEFGRIGKTNRPGSRTPSEIERFSINWNIS